MHADPQTLQAYLEHELPSHAEKEIEQHLAQCEQCHDALALLQQDEERFHTAILAISPREEVIPDPHQALARLRQHQAQTLRQAEPSLKTSPKPSWFETLRQSILWAGPVFSAAIVMLVLWRGPFVTSPQIKPQKPLAGDRMKNGTPFAIAMFAHKQQRPASSLSYAKTQVLRDGQQLSPGDLLQFILRLPHTTHCLILSINQKREVFVYLPLEQERSLELTAGEHLYPNSNSMELDDTLGQERFFIFFSKHPLPVKTIKRRVRDALTMHATPKTLQPPEGPWLVQSFWIWKKQ
ncbi:MAG: zf-HC2 domain-containing protein [Myxococcales bacterium]|nr:zf-HC2 domain-containing protein [Myxococcales bacterium]